MLSKKKRKTDSSLHKWNHLILMQQNERFHLLLWVGDHLVKLIDYPPQLCLCVSFSFDGRGCMHVCALCVACLFHVYFWVCYTTFLEWGKGSRYQFVNECNLFLCRPQVTIATAIIFCHRFFIRQSHAKNDRRVSHWCSNKHCFCFLSYLNGYYLHQINHWIWYFCTSLWMVSDASYVSLQNFKSNRFRL